MVAEGIEDTKEIRTRHLQNLGGASYGTLVRKLLKEKNENRNSPIFLVGAGQIAQSVAPALLDFGLKIWNRDPVRLCGFHQDLICRSHAPIQKIQTQEEEAQAWKEARQIVVCIPYDEKSDAQRVQWFQQNPDTDRTIIHLGGMTGQSSIWESLPQYYCLNDLFSLQSTMDQIRMVQIAQAQRACQERAQLRALGASLSIAHGWEDLAVFA